MMTQRGPVLVTGASGFVGRWAVAGLLRRGVEVVAAGRSSGGGSVRTIACDLRDETQVARLLDEVRPETVLHLAWTTEHGQFWSAPDNLDWVAATMTLARHAARTHVGRFVGVGTCFEYRWPTDGDCVEEATPLQPTTLYAVAKDATRRVLQEWAPFSFSWARLFYLYGPHEDSRRLVASVASRLAQRTPAPISRGLAIRDFLDVRDAGDGLAALALSDVEGPVNIASGRGVSVREIAERLGQLAGRADLVMAGAMPDRDEPPRIVGDIGRLRDEVGFEPERDLDRGLAECYAWWRDRLDRRRTDQQDLSPQDIQEHN